MPFVNNFFLHSDYNILHDNRFSICVRMFDKMAYLPRPIRPSVRMHQRGCHWTDFVKIFYWGLL
jgi:hypothetical protein